MGDAVVRADGGGFGRVAWAGAGDDEDLERFAVAVFGAEYGVQRDSSAEPAAGVEHYAGEGESGARGADGHGGIPDCRKRRGGGDGSAGGATRAECDDAGDGAQCTAVDHDSDEYAAGTGCALRSGNHGQS